MEIGLTALQDAGASAVVRGVNDDGVVGDLQIIDFFKNITDASVEVFGHRRDHGTIATTTTASVLIFC